MSDLTDSVNDPSPVFQSCDRETIPYQIKAPERGLCSQHAERLRQLFPEFIPARPYCTDYLKQGLVVREKSSALKFRHLQWNGPTSYRWMLHDIDRPDAGVAHADANLPEPNVIIINRANGHAHSGVLLESAVSRQSASRVKPLRFFAAVERGISRRLGADPHYAGLIAKNPLHSDWRVEWRRERPYSLHELAHWLDEDDMRPERVVERQIGASRNCTVFDEARGSAYRDVIMFKRDGASVDEWRAHVLRVCESINGQFVLPLPDGEVRAIAKSIAKWVWGRFSPERYADFMRRLPDIQRARVRKRWAGHVADSSTKPWEALGISRATYYRRKASGQIAAQTGTRH